MREYDRIAEWFAAERGGEMGVPEVRTLAASLPPHARVLDAGCGTGRPLAQTLRRAGHRVVGLDSAREMLARFRANLPAAPAVRGLLQQCPFAAGTFDAVLAWGLMFHLPPAQQIDAIASVARILRPGASFLFTAGEVEDRAGHVGVMDGVDFPYYSLGLAEYRRCLQDQGLRLADVHRDRGGNSHYLARKEP